MPADPAAGPSRKRRAELAVQLAVQRRWDEASRVNDGLWREDPTDTEAANRLAKALTELGDAARAIAVYEQVLTAEPGNSIARKNLDRLRLAGAARGGPGHRASGHTGSGAARPRGAPLLESSGQAAEFTLLRPAAAALAEREAGDRVAVEATEHGVRIVDADGAFLGTIDRRAGRRLARLIAGGNRYRAVLSRLELADEEAPIAAVHIRETQRSPQQADEASFLQSRERAEESRAYSSSQRYTDDDPPDMAEVGDDDEPDEWDDSDDDEAEMAERGFTRTGAGAEASTTTADADDDDDDEGDGDEDSEDDAFEDDDEIDPDDLDDADLDDEDLDDSEFADLDDEDLDDANLDDEDMDDAELDDGDDEDDGDDDR